MYTVFCCIAQRSLCTRGTTSPKPNHYSTICTCKESRVQFASLKIPLSEPQITLQRQSPGVQHSVLFKISDGWVHASSTDVVAQARFLRNNKKLHARPRYDNRTYTLNCSWSLLSNNSIPTYLPR